MLFREDENYLLCFSFVNIILQMSSFSKWREFSLQLSGNGWVFECYFWVLPFDSLNNKTAECKVSNSGRHIYIHCFSQVTSIHSLPNDIHNLKILRFIQQKNLSIKNIFQSQKQPLWLDLLTFSSCMFHWKKDSKLFTLFIDSYIPTLVTSLLLRTSRG